jgi:triphosphoribosyl-dephospho-CoA synthase
MPITPSLAAYLACTWDVLTPKVGNVHLEQPSEDASAFDYLASAGAIAPLMDTASERGVGATVLEAIQRTRQVARSNTNLGIVLLLAPLAAVPSHLRLAEGISAVLEALTVEDSRLVFTAIRLAQPGGLGRVETQDVHGEPTWPLQAIMRLAADRDLVARQYAQNYQDVFQRGLHYLLLALQQGQSLRHAITGCHLHLLAELGDSHIARRHGEVLSQQAARRAEEVLNSGWPHTAEAAQKFAELDTWLRQHRCNPGATADLVVATLFVAFRDGFIPLPFSGPL